MTVTIQENARILIVDDRESNILLLKNILVDEGYTHIETLRDSRQVFSQVKNFKPDLILLDLMMPHLDGYTVMEKLQEIIPKNDFLPILVLTADATIDAKLRALSLGAKDFLSKPFDQIEVLLRVKNLLETRQLHVQTQNQNQILEKTVIERTASILEKEDQYRALVEYSNYSIHEIDLKGRLGFINKSGLQMLGVKKNDTVRGTLFLDHVTDRDKKRIKALLNQAIKGKQSDFEFDSCNGLHLQSSFVPMLDPSGKVIRLMGFAEDITRRKEAEDTIRQEIVHAKYLARAATRLNARLDMKGVMDTVCEETAQALNVPAASISLYDEKKNVLEVAVQVGLPKEYIDQHIPIPRATFEKFSTNNESVVMLWDVQSSGLPDLDLYVKNDIRTIVTAPMTREGILVGGLNLYSFKEPRKFSNEELILLKNLADQAAIAISGARLYAESQNRMRNIQALHSIDLAIAGSLDMNLTLNIALEQVTKQLRVDAADVLLLNPYNQTLEFSAGRGFYTDNIEHSYVRLGEGITGRAVLDLQTAYIPDLKIESKEFMRVNLLASEGFVTYYGVPLVAKGELKGVLEIFNRTFLESSKDWLEFLETISGQVAIAVDSAQMFAGLKRSNFDLLLAYEATIEGWSRALDMRDNETEGHTLRVTELTVQLAQIMGISKDDLVHIRRGTLLHDIGKMGIPDSILLKPGPLTDEERIIMNQHPRHAFDMLSPIEFLHPAINIPYCHHEKWDGSGYPRGLKGDQIPIAARIFAVIDVWDALTSDRPYRKAWGREKTKEHIKSLSGTHFDPMVIEPFFQLIDKSIDYQV